MKADTAQWSSRLAFSLATVGAAVGLGSIWRFPYLVGTHGGSAFVLVFSLACVAVAIPLLTAEFLIGRAARVNPMQAAGVVAAVSGCSSRWGAIGVLGTVATYLIMSYYTIIAGWVLAYAWKCASGALTGLGQGEVEALWRGFIADPRRIGAWHLGFLAILGAISARGVNRGLEVASRVRAPILLALLLVLVAYALITGDVARGLTFAFAPDVGDITPQVVLAAVGQAFYATGVGMAMMIAYGAYAPASCSLLRSASLIVVSILVVSILATVAIFPLVFRFGMNPAQGPDLVFNVLPTAFSIMPGGRIIGTLFFLLLVLAALTPSIAGIEPIVAWLEQRLRLSRGRAVVGALVATWVLGFGSVLSFNIAANWHPLGAIAFFGDKTFFDVVDYVSSNILLPIGALLTAIFVGWRLPAPAVAKMFADATPTSRLLTVWALRIVCPLAILAVLSATLL